MITLNLRYRELCAIKHALNHRVKDKKSKLIENDIDREKLIDEIVEEKILINNLEKVIEKHRYKRSL